MFVPVQNVPAGIRSVATCASAPSTPSIRRWAVSVVVADTGAGATGLYIDPSGTTKRKGTKHPELTGISGKMCFIPIISALIVLLNGQLNGPRHCGALRERSNVISDPET